jgi:hypothetical protein
MVESVNRGLPDKASLDVARLDEWTETLLVRKANDTFDVAKCKKAWTLPTLNSRINAYFFD